jgi:hypothetical protein
MCLPLSDRWQAPHEQKESPMSNLALAYDLEPAAEPATAIVEARDIWRRYGRGDTAVDAVRDGQTTVMVTHDPNAAAIADRVLFLADGRIQ